MRFFILLAFLVGWAIPQDETPVDYSGHKVITVTPNDEEELEFLRSLGMRFLLDFWTDPRTIKVPIMIRISPEYIDDVEEALKEAGMTFKVSILDLQRAIEAERVANAPTPEIDKRASAEHFQRYLQIEEINQFLQSVASSYPSISSVITIGATFENRKIMGVKIGSDNSGTKPAILIECGIHAREWVSVSSCLYNIHELTSKYATDSTIKSLVDDHIWYIIPSSNPDGYVYTWTMDRMWRKTRSRSIKFVPPWCRGADANRNFDISHCGPGTSTNPCEDIYCGDSPFSENESRALRDLINQIGGSRIKVYFAVHSYSQLWMYPYGHKRVLPPNHEELDRLCKIGTDALRKVHGTNFKCGSISNIIYPAAGSSLDWAYEKAGVKIGFALELRDEGRHGFMLPKDQIIPTCEETFKGIEATVLAIQ
ncbi:carboxypeptidase B-like [Centruroides sculpturatus]|uniref:carboxypeptidase B-like n=1 Tax=Centruroides sculpturatus TaxID=218467 RepID=UPI000C6D62D7|nr:carboxypeptidase B-like [Centruroides sculpturatus]